MMLPLCVLPRIERALKYPWRVPLVTIIQSLIGLAGETGFQLVFPALLKPLSPLSPQAR
jgi:hypothetical protein